LTVILNSDGECVLCEISRHIGELKKFVDKSGDDDLKEAFGRFKDSWDKLVEIIDGKYGFTYQI